jgi:2-polyprenyl-3-methyl-5-hydroxy-6-metoxy-1,4-benzoquinol methylase
MASLEDGIPAEAGDGFDIVVAADVIEHLRRPAEVLRDMRRVLRPGGQVLLSVPNFAHWYPRARVSLGMFGYDGKGILDETHLRFFTRATLRRMVRASGFDILEEQATGLPLRTISGADGRDLRVTRRVDRALVRARPTLFGYQFVLRLTPHAEEAVHVEVI